MSLFDQDDYSLGYAAGLEDARVKAVSMLYELIIATLGSYDRFKELGPEAAYESALLIAKTRGA
jgi:hypothetical protein